VVDFGEPNCTLYIKNINEKYNKSKVLPELKATLQKKFSPHGEIVDIVALSNFYDKGQVVCVCVYLYKHTHTHAHTHTHTHTQSLNHPAHARTHARAIFSIIAAQVNLRLSSSGVYECMHVYIISSSQVQYTHTHTYNDSVMC
jgi:hypothetical protein